MKDTPREMLSSGLLNMLRPKRLASMGFLNALRLMIQCAWTEFRYRPFLGSMGFLCTLNIAQLIGGKNIRLGNRVDIMFGARLEAITRFAGVAFKPRITIGDRVSIGPNLHCVAVKEIVIGSDTLMGGNVVIVDAHHSYEDVSQPTKDSSLIVSSVEIGPECLLYQNVVILPGTKLGRHCVVGANSVVKGEWSDYSILAGAPARLISQYDLQRGGWVRADNDRLASRSE